MSKHAYFTVIQRFEQGISDTLILADIVLEQFCADFPLVDEVYIKSDIAGSYHINSCFEVLYNTNILTYDYNEPCCGKDQCDMESAAAKSLLRSFVGASNMTTSK